MTNLPDPATAPGAIRVTKRPLDVAVRFADRDGVWETLEGPVRYRAGDALVTGVRGECWPVQRDSFLASYVPMGPTLLGEDGRYVKSKATAMAVRLERAVTVTVGWRADPLNGRPGDWLLRYDDGSLGVVQDGIFRETYGPAD
jgi:hypothetical protein